MSEVTSTPPPPGTQPSGGQGQGPQHVTGPRTSTDGASTEEQKSAQEQAPQETEKSTARFDTAVAVSPTLAHLEPGQEIRGDIVRIDGEGRPVLETREAAYALEPDAGLRKDDRIAILIETVEKRAIGQLIEKAGQRLEVPVSVRLTLLSLHRTPEVLPEDQEAHTESRRSGYDAPTGHSRGTTAEFDFESSALALPDSGIPAHGAAPGAAVVPAPEEPDQTLVPPKGKKAPANLTGTLLKAGEQAATTLPAAPGATRVYAQTFGGKEASTPSGNAQSSGSLIGQPVVAAPSVPHEKLAGGPVQVQTALTGVLRPGNQLIARLVAATDGAPARQGLGSIVPGDSVTLTILAQGAEQANLAGSQAFVGIITSVAEIAASAKDITGLGLIPDAEKATSASPQTTAAAGPEGVDRRAAPRTGPQSDRHYIKSPAGAFLFHAAEKIAIGTRVTLTATPGLPSTQQAGAPQAGAAEVPVATQTSTPVTQPQGQPSQVQPTETPPPTALPPLVSYQAAWPLLDEMIEAVAAADPAAARALAPRISAPGARLSSGLLFFLSAVRMQSPRAWIGEQTARALEAKGKGGLLSRLKEEFARLGRFSADKPGADWRPFLIPLQTEQGTQAIALLTRPHHEEGDSASPDDGSGDDEDLTDNQRFLLEVKLSTIGPVQLDGLMRPERLDMVVRAGDLLTAAMRDDLRNIFESATGAAGLKGSLSFEPLSRSPVDVSRVLAQAQLHALAGNHDAGTLA